MRCSQQEMAFCVPQPKAQAIMLSKDMYSLSTQAVQSATACFVLAPWTSACTIALHITLSGPAYIASPCHLFQSREVAALTPQRKGLARLVAWARQPLPCFNDL